MRLPVPAVLVITDRRQAHLPLEETAAALFAGGCRWLSLREKDLSQAERRALLRRLVVLGQGFHAAISVHDDLAAAAETGAAGIHLPASGAVAEARRVLGAEALIGISAHSADEVTRAADAGADYATLSPIFLSASKPGYGPALGLAGLRRPWPLPLLALGGVDARNAADCLAAGASGVALMGEAMRALDPRDVMADLLARLRGSLAAPPAGAHSFATPRNGRAPP
ncbi:MAG TPA: thiamine phosphate synthase [Stellaceae bacterium]|nr:thiamine phosphate synthase [Stellaceae bacterium]